MEMSYELLSLYGIKCFKKRKQERRCKYPTCYPGMLQKVASLKKTHQQNQKPQNNKKTLNTTLWNTQNKPHYSVQVLYKYPL